MPQGRGHVLCRSRGHEESLMWTAAW